MTAYMDVQTALETAGHHITAPALFELHQRLARVPRLTPGKHAGIGHGACVMEAVCYLDHADANGHFPLDARYTDEPESASTTIRTFVTNWHDAVPQDDLRDKLFRPLVPVIMDTRTPTDPEAPEDPEIEKHRTLMALDFLIRRVAHVFLLDVDLSIANDFEQMQPLAVYDGMPAAGILDQVWVSKMTGLCAQGGVLVKAARARREDAAPPLMDTFREAAAVQMVREGGGEAAYRAVLDNCSLDTYQVANVAYRILALAVDAAQCTRFDSVSRLRMLQREAARKVCQMAKAEG